MCAQKNFSLSCYMVFHSMVITMTFAHKFRPSPWDWLIAKLVA